MNTETDTPTISEHDAQLGIWWENPEDPRVQSAQRQIIRHFRDRGFKMMLDPEVKKHYRSISKDHHVGKKGDLHVCVSRAGRCIEIRFWQELVVENRNGGRYDFGQRFKMPYMIRKRYEFERDLLVAALDFPFEPCQRTNPLRGLDFIRDQRTNRKHTFFPCPLGEYDPTKYPSNAESMTGSLLHDGDDVYFVSPNGDARWRVQHGTAYHNINNMWWVLLPSGEVRNVASFEIKHASELALPVRRGRIIPDCIRLARVKNEKAKAVEAENYELAAVLRDVLQSLVESTTPLSCEQE